MNKQSESPKERINVTYKPATGDMNEEIEIPFKLTVLGEYNPDVKKISVEERKAVNVNKDNFNEVLKEQNLSVNFDVPNKLDENSESLNVNLKFNSIKDFSPENIVENVSDIKKLMDLRKSLVALKGPLGNVPAFKKAIEEAILDDGERDKLLSEIVKSNS